MLPLINVLLAVAGLLGAIAAFGGKTWLEGDDPLRKRITHRGWIALCGFFVTFLLSLAKEAVTDSKFDSTVDGKLTAVIPGGGLFPLVKQTTGYTEDKWNLLMSYRIATRFLLRRLYVKDVGNDNKLSIQDMASTLSAGGFIDDALKAHIVFISEKTFTAEWGTGTAPTPLDLVQLDTDAPDTIRALANLAK